MKKSIGLILGIVIVIALALIISPYFVGKYAERNYIKIVTKEFNSPRVKINLQSYQRGWFKSKLHFTIMLQTNNSTGNKPGVFSINETIFHGPVILQHTGHNLKIEIAKAIIDSKSDDIQLNLIANSRLDFANVLTTQFEIAAVKTPYADKTLQLKNVNGHLKYKLDTSKLKFTAAIEKLKMQNQAGGGLNNEIILNNYQTNGDYQKHAGFWLGTDKINVGLAQFSNGEQTFKVYNLKTQSSYNQVSNNTNIGFNLSAEKIDLPHESVGPAELDLSLDKLHTETLNTFLRTHHAASLMELLGHGLRLNLTKLNLTTRDGVISITGHALIPNIKGSTDLFKVLSQARIALNISAPQKLIHRQLLMYYQTLHRTTGIQAHNLAKRDLKIWIANKILIQKDLSLSVKASFVNGKLLVNGTSPNLKVLIPSPPQTPHTSIKVPAKPLVIAPQQSVS
ncbi:MAG: YdgA family protein [Gammaproteobacteria bacterium]|nr:YdgA family protein [Gammaproteobacteria bacterium]